MCCSEAGTEIDMSRREGKRGRRREKGQREMKASRWRNFLSLLSLFLCKKPQVQKTKI